MAEKTCKQALLDTVGFLPKDAIGWLYVARGMYKKKEYRFVIEAVSHCLRNDKTVKEAQHLLAFSLLHSGQTTAGSAFMKSVAIGNDSDWQPLVEFCVDNPNHRFS